MSNLILLVTMQNCTAQGRALQPTCLRKRERDRDRERETKTETERQERDRERRERDREIWVNRKESVSVGSDQGQPAAAQSYLFLCGCSGTCFPNSNLARDQSSSTQPRCSESLSETHHGVLPPTHCCSRKWKQEKEQLFWGWAGLHVCGRGDDMFGVWGCSGDSEK